MDIKTSMQELDLIEGEINTRLANRIPYLTELQRYAGTEDSNSAVSYLKEAKRVPIGQVNDQLFTIPFEKRKTFVVVGSPGSGKTVTAKLIVFDVLHALFGFYVISFSPKLEYTTGLMGRNTKWKNTLNKFGLPTVAHNIDVYTPEFSSSVAGQRFKFDLKDLEDLGDQEWDSALYDILGLDDSPTSKSIVEYIKSKGGKPKSVSEMKRMLGEMFDQRKIAGIDSYFNPASLRAVYSRLSGVHQYLGGGEGRNVLNFPKLLTKGPVVFQSSVGQANEFISLYSGLIMQMLRTDRTNYVNLSRQNKSTEGYYLDRPTVIMVEEARFFVSSRRRSLSKAQIVEGAKTDRDVKVYYCLVEQDLKSLDSMITGNMDFYIYKGVPSKDNIEVIRNSFTQLSKDDIDNWVRHSYTADADGGESPLNTTTAYITKRGIRVMKSIPSMCNIVQEAG